MGSSESTDRSNNEEDDRQPPQNNTSDRGGSGTGKKLLAAALIAWGVYKMISTNEETESQENGSSGTGEAIAVAVAAAGVAVVVWGVYKIISKAAAGAAVVAWGVYKMVTNQGTELRHENDDRIEPQGKSSNAWTPPPEGIYKLNTDANSKNPGPGGYGGILRDHQGNWIRGFRGYIGDGDILTAELQGILKGLELLNRLGYKGSILESDSEQAINWINGDNQKVNRYEEIIKRCRHLRQVNKISLEWIRRDYNKCADKLAKMGVKGGEQEPYEEMSDIPDDYQLKVFIRSDQTFV